MVKTHKGQIRKDGRIWGQNNSYKTLEYRNKISISNGGKGDITKDAPYGHYIKKGWNPKSIGKPFEKGHKGKPMLGKHHSKKTKEKMSKRHKGKQFSEETKRKMREHHKGMLGKKFSEKAKRKMSKSLKGVNNPLYGKHHSEVAKRKMREATIRYLSSGKMKNKETIIEQKIEAELKRRNIYYEKQVPLYKVTLTDFYLPETRTVIYCDGDYWHSREGRKDRDINQDIILTFNGFNVYRFTEMEINKSPKRCINKNFERRNE